MPENQSYCRVCSSPTNFLWSAELIGVPVDYFECPNCDYVQTQSPHWLDVAYSSAINDSDTGVMRRNLSNCRLVLGVLYLLNNVHGKVLDYAGGWGILVRLLRDVGVDARWFDKYCENLVAKGFEHKATSYQLVSAFEAFEHFEYPLEELKGMLEHAPNVLLSTELIRRPSPAHRDWWYYGQEHGQHIGFFRVKTLQHMAKKMGKHLVTDGRNYHLFSDKAVSPFSWKVMIKLNKLYSFFVKRRLSSKTWSDFLEFSDN